jgi:protein N-terminal methyltransferase
VGVRFDTFSELIREQSEKMEGPASEDATGTSNTSATAGVGPDSLISFDDGKQYWESVNADLDGIMGGFPHITKVDLQGSKNFLAKFGIGLKEGKRTIPKALEGGAG